MFYSVRIKVVPAPGAGPQGRPWSHSEAGGLLHCLILRSPRSSQIVLSAKIWGFFLFFSYKPAN